MLVIVVGWTEHMDGAAGGVAGLSALDDATLVVRLTEPFEPILDVLADPAFGISGVGDSGLLRTTGLYLRGDEPSQLLAREETAPVSEIELVSHDDRARAAIADWESDWVVLTSSDRSDGLDADVIRLPLGIQLAIVSRLDSEQERLGALAALEPLLLAGEVAGLTARPVSGSTSSGALPAALVVDVPIGPLDDAMSAQLVAAGVEAVAIPTERAVFSARVASGEAAMFPVVVPGGLNGLLQLGTPGRVDHVFGSNSEARAELAQAVRAEVDPAQRGIFLAALERALIEDGLLLPIGRFEVRVAISQRLDGRRHRADGTLDLSGVRFAE